MDKFRRRDDDKFSQVDLERELECGICFEVNPKIVLPDCAHSLCLRCFEDWYHLFPPLPCLIAYISNAAEESLFRAFAHHLSC